MDRFPPVRFVLDHTSHPGNIGATARAMKVMGLSELHLVTPSEFPSAEATARASSADDLLAAARVHDTLDQALADCVWVAGTSHRAEQVDQPLYEPREAVHQALQQSGPVAVVFGCERSGLDNTAMDRCNALIRIPTGPDYTSLNLAQAVQILAYEFHLALRSGPTQGIHSGKQAASAERMAVFFQRLDTTLAAIRFSTPGQDEMLRRRLRRVFMRARPDDDELNMLNGMLSRTLYTAERCARDDPENEDRPDQDGPDQDRPA
jgi:TrmH family RNA methyltransferase